MIRRPCSRSSLTPLNKLLVAQAIQRKLEERAFLETVPPRLREIFSATQRIILLVGGRGSGKSIAAGKFVKRRMAEGQRWMMTREFQNSIDESVHTMIKEEIDLDPEGLHADSTKVYGDGSKTLGIYRGLARNLESMKSTIGLDGNWTEEAATLSDKSLDMLLPTVREEGSQLLFTMNRGASTDPIAKRLLKPYEKALAKDGRYCDDDILIIEINYYDNPFFPKVLEQQRRMDEELLPRAKYRHIWHGEYSDSIDNAIIQPEWFDACIDAHKVLGFDAVGQDRVAYDPADSGDEKAVGHMRGQVVLDIKSTEFGDVDEATKWALDFAHDKRPDVFVWDAVGIGLGLKAPITTALSPKGISVEAFTGGSTPEHPDAIYQPHDGEVKDAKTNRETFANLRAQRYWQLRDRMFKTYLAVTKGRYINPAELISFSSEIEQIDQLRSEVCRIPRKFIGTGKIQLYGKPEMKTKFNVDSPNMADVLMMMSEEVAVEEDDFDYSQYSPGISY